MSEATTKTRMINIRATDDQYESIKDFARFQGKSVSSLLLDAVWEKIEDYEDIRDAEQIIAAHEETSAWDDVQKAAGLL